MSFENIQNAIIEAQIELREAISDKISDITDSVSDQGEKVLISSYSCNIISPSADGLVQNLKDALMTKEMQDALNTIEFVLGKTKPTMQSLYFYILHLDKLKQADMAAKEYDSFMFILFALVKKAQKLEVDSDLEKKKAEPTVLTDLQLKEVGRFGGIAVQMYPLSWSLSSASVARSVGVSEEDILMVHFTDDDGGHCPKFLFFVDHQSRSLVLAIRGTFSLKDAILDAVAEEVPFLEGFAHKGILSGASLILSKVSGKLQEVLAQPECSGYSLVVTGHSLGAGTAELITMSLLSSDLLPGHCQVRCVSLAPPPVFRSQKKVAEKISAAIEIYINNYDCVPRLSLASVSRLLATVREVDSLVLSLAEQLSILADRDNPQVRQNILKLRNIVKVQRKSFPDLEHPGTIYHIMRSTTDDKKHLVYSSKSSAFTSAILLLENMIVDHLHSSYETTILNLNA